tara:strand:+ start:13612 stop:14073 length:462 start_codon:yes stop_codon:yes gene_type:complete
MDSKDDTNYNCEKNHSFEIIEKLKNSQKIIKILRKQNRELQNHIDDVLNINNKDSTDLIDKISDYEIQIKKLEIDNNCLLYQLHSYESLFKNIKIENKKDDVLCILCFDSPRNVIFKPCNHILICDNCSSKTNYDECFVCRSKIAEYEYAYLI